MRLVCAFDYEGRAVGKARARVALVGGRAHAYTPKATAEFETAVGLHAQLAMRRAGSLAADEAVEVRVTMTRRPPPSWSKRRRAAAIGRLIAVKPDLDNEVKAILDALNGVAFLDDAQVGALHIVRRYGHDDAIRVEVLAEPAAEAA